MLSKITHVIFDCDNTLINFVDLLPKVLDCMVEKLGKNNATDMNDTKKVIKQAINVKDVLKIMVKEFNISDQEFLTNLLYESTEQISSEIKLMPGVEKLIMYLHKHNIPMAVATGATTSLYETRTKKFRYLLKPGNFISHVVCSDEDPEVTNNKPHPDVFLVCAKRFVKPPKSMKNVLVIEDMYTAVQGAITAGMTTLLVPSKEWTETSREKCNCDLVLQSLDQFQPQLFGLPPF